MAAVITNHSPELARRAAPSAPPRPREPRPLRIGLLGLGVVGQGLARLVSSQQDAIAARHGVRLAIASVLVRDADKPRAVTPANAKLTTRVEDFLSCEYDLVVEALGGIEPAFTLVSALLARGTPVVTGNKTLLAARGDELRLLARTSRTVLAYEASVAAGIPVLRLLQTSLKTTRVERLAAVLNGTSNFVLSRIDEQGIDLETALREAGERGFTEPDPAFDLDGDDAAQKLRVLWHGLGGGTLGAIEVESIRGVSAEDCRLARQLGLRLRPVALAAREVGGTVAFVAPAAVSAEHPLAHLRGEQNGILLRGDTIEELFLAGPGAGAIPTAAAIIDDILAIERGTWPIEPAETEAPGESAAAPAVPWPRFWRLHLARSADLEEVLARCARRSVEFTRLRENATRDGLAVAGLSRAIRGAVAQELTAELSQSGLVTDIRSYRVIADER
jgi:homoserine dehydrogenase